MWQYASTWHAARSANPLAKRLAEHRAAHPNCQRCQEQRGVKTSATTATHTITSSGARFVSLCAACERDINPPAHEVRARRRPMTEREKLQRLARMRAALAR